jgi:hypothetical protein
MRAVFVLCVSSGMAVLRLRVTSVMIVLVLLVSCEMAVLVYVVILVHPCWCLVVSFDMGVFVFASRMSLCIVAIWLELFYLFS